MEEGIAQFVERLAGCQPPANVFNQYSHDSELNSGRRHNLTLYLKRMRQVRPKVLLVAEAPGYRGMRLTGVPFTSPSLVRSGIDGFQLFGESRGYRSPMEHTHIQKEQSGTIVWQTLQDNKALPLIWNSFPFHPHLPGKPLSNRTPTAKELEMGLPFLREMIGLFAIEQVVAIGNKAHDSLTRLGFTCEKVRHPAQSGKNQFVEGIGRILQGG
jgi:uracil-DNA glycosylase